MAKFFVYNNGAINMDAVKRVYFLKDAIRFWFSDDNSEFIEVILHDDYANDPERFFDEILKKLNIEKC